MGTFSTPTEVGVLLTNNVTYTIANVQVVVHAPGSYDLQHLVRGIASNNVRFTVSQKTGWTLVGDAGVTDGTYFPTQTVMLLLVSFCFLAGSTKWAHPVVMVLAIGGCCFYIWVVVKGNTSSYITTDLALQIGYQLKGRARPGHADRVPVP